MKKVKKASKFALDTAEPTVLTHRGQALGDATYNDQDWNESSDDENIQKEAVSRLHFGGGFIEAGPGGQRDTPGGPDKRTHADVLQEIVMKSKLFKLEKKEAKDAQEGQRELIDDAYDSLVKDALLEFKPTKRDRSEMNGHSATEMDAYDSALRTMAFESKVQASNRTESVEESTEAARKRTAQLETERLKRMKIDPLSLTPTHSLPGKGPGQNVPALNDDCIYELYEEYTTRNRSRGVVTGGHPTGQGEDSEELSDSDDSDSIDWDWDPNDTAELSSITQEITPVLEAVSPTVTYPQNLSDFEDMMRIHGTDMDDFSSHLDSMVTRKGISTQPSVGTEAKGRFFKILLEYIIKLGDSLPSLSQESHATLAKVKAVTLMSHIIHLSCNSISCRIVSYLCFLTSYLHWCRCPHHPTLFHDCL